MSVKIDVSEDLLSYQNELNLLINKIEGKEVKLRILHISGTIKKLEERAKEMLSNWLQTFEDINNSKNVNLIGQKSLSII